MPVDKAILFGERRQIVYQPLRLRSVQPFDRIMIDRADVK